MQAWRPLQLLLAVVLAGWWAATASAKGHGRDDFSNSDWSAILANRTAVEHYIACVLEKEPCDEKGHKIKKLVPLMVIRLCRGCTAMQRKNAWAVRRLLHNDFPDVWGIIFRKYMRTWAS